jgi:hypothetical protein
MRVDATKFKNLFLLLSTLAVGQFELITVGSFLKPVNCFKVLIYPEPAVF